MTIDYSELKKKVFTRHNVYTGLLIFVVLVGGSMGVIPQLRHRIWDRAHALKSAFSGEVQPASAQVGENSEPFPEEYAREMPPVLDQSQLPAAVFANPPAGEASNAPSPRRIRIPQTSGVEGRTPPILVRKDSPESPEDNLQIESPDSAPKYQQGRLEQDAYDLVLKSNKALADLVRGGDPSLHFKSWDAAFRGEDVYWVRVIFQGEGKPDVAYIWQVKLSIGEITPLSFNARSLF